MQVPRRGPRSRRIEAGPYRRVAPRAVRGAQHPDLTGHAVRMLAAVHDESIVGLVVRHAVTDDGRRQRARRMRLRPGDGTLPVCAVEDPHFVARCPARLRHATEGYEALRWRVVYRPYPL